MAPTTRGDGPAAVVLVVEDDAGVRDLLAATLELDGYQALEAATGAAALDALAQYRVDLVLLDNHLPDRSGIDLIADIRAIPRLTTLPVLLVTGDADVRDRVAGLEAGADDYIVKPFAPDEVLARVGARLRGQRSWARMMDDRLEARAGVTRALRRALPTGGPPEVADTVCRQLLRLPDLAGAAIVQFCDPARGIVLGSAGDLFSELGAGQPLPLAWTDELRALTGRGPDYEVRGLSFGTDDALTRGVVWAPIGGRTQPDGLLILMLGPRAADRIGDTSAALAAAIDFAAVVESMLADHFDRNYESEARTRTLVDVLAQHDFIPHFQPITRLTDGVVEGVEALTRFGDGADPATRFRDAHSLGMGRALEVATIAEAIVAAVELPADNWLSLNVSADLVLGSDQLASTLESCNRPVVLEISEHDPVDDYVELRDAISDLSTDVRVSVDDAGSGFASLRHVLQLSPAFMKLDRSWVTHIDEDPARQALVAGLRHFAASTGSRLIAEGIERAPEVRALRDLGVELGQGFLLGRPRPVVGAPA